VHEEEEEEASSGRGGGIKEESSANGGGIHLWRSIMALESLEVRKLRIPRIIKLGGVSPGWQRAVIITAGRIMYSHIVLYSGSVTCKRRVRGQQRDRWREGIRQAREEKVKTFTTFSDTFILFSLEGNWALYDTGKTKCIH